MRRLALILVLLLPVTALAEMTEWRKSFRVSGGSVDATFRVVNRSDRTFRTSFGSFDCLARIAPVPGGEGELVEWACSDGGHYLSSLKPGTKRLMVVDVKQLQTNYPSSDSFFVWAHNLAVQAVP